MTSQRDLMQFDDDLPTLLERAGDEGPASHQWPQTLADLLDVTRAALLDAGIEADQADGLSRKITAAQAHYLGGQPLYLPRGDALRTALKHAAIYRAWDGRRETKYSLARESGMTPRQIERIIVEQSRLHRDRFQGTLFQRTGND